MRGKNPLFPFWKLNDSNNLLNLESPLIEDALCQVQLKFYYMYFVIISLLGIKGHGLSFEQTWTPPIQGSYVPNMVEIGPVVLEKTSNFVDVFLLFLYYLHWEGHAPSIGKLEFPSPNMLCAKFGWNWPSCFGEEDEKVKKFTDGR